MENVNAKYYVNNGGADIEVHPLEPIKITYTLEDGRYTKAVNTVKLWREDADTVRGFGKYAGAVFRVRALSGALKFEGAIHWRGFNEKQNTLELDARASDVVEFVNANASRATNLLTFGETQPAIIFEVKPSPSTPTAAFWSQYFEAVTSSLGNKFDIYVTFRSATPRAGWTYSGGYYWREYVLYPGGSPDRPEPTWLLQNSAADVPGYRFLQPLTDGSGQYLFVELASLVYDTALGREFEFNSITYGNGVALRDALNYLLQKIPSTLEVRSAFLFDDPVETGSTWSRGAVDGYDPQILSLFSASDLKNPDADNPARIMNMTLQSLLTSLKVLNCYWFEDLDGYLRIEHLSYKQAGGTIDLRGVTGGRGLPVADELQVLNYTDTDTEAKIELGTPAGVSDGYAPAFLAYTQTGIDRTRTRSESLDGLTTDWLAAVDGLDAVPSELPVLVSIDRVTKEPAAVLSFPEIILHLWRHEANFAEFQANGAGAVINAATTAYKVAAEPVFYSENQQPLLVTYAYKTHYDEGNTLARVESAVLDTLSGIIELNLKFQEV